jgi:hypothetical protein
MVIYKELVFMVGGRNSTGHAIPVDVLNLRNLKWYKLPPINNFRHCSWSNTGLLYSYGGFENTQPDIPIGRLLQINIVEMLSSIPSLQRQIKDLTKGGASNPTNVENGKKDFLQESILNKYDLNPNVVVARIEQQNNNKALHYYPLNALQKEGEKINSKLYFLWIKLDK